MPTNIVDPLRLRAALKIRGLRSLPTWTMIFLLDLPPFLQGETGAGHAVLPAGRGPCVEGISSISESLPDGFPTGRRICRKRNLHQNHVLEVQLSKHVYPCLLGIGDLAPLMERRGNRTRLPS